MSWFKRTPAVVAAPAAAPPPPAPSVARPVAVDPSAALIARWDGIIADTHAQLRAILDEAAVASEPLIAAIHSDLRMLGLPWNTLTVRVRQAREVISNAWNKISDEMSASGAFTHDMLRHEGSKRDLAGLELELLHDRIYGAVMARAADRMRAVALGADAAAHPCNRCGATLDNVRPVSQSLNVACAYCGAVNTVHPGDALRRFAVSGAPLLADEAARPTGEAMRRLEVRIKQVRDAKDVPLALLIELEATARTFWTTRLSEQARYNPDDLMYVPAKLDRYMSDVVKGLRRYWQWREHEASAR